jgi:uncharacterized protein YxjI
MTDPRRHIEADEIGAVSSDDLPGNTFTSNVSGVRYRVAQNLAAKSDGIVITNDQGKPAFKVDGQALSERDLVLFRDLAGNLLCEIAGSDLRLEDAVPILSPTSVTLATVKRSPITPVRDQFSIRPVTGPIWTVHGRIAWYSYHISSQEGEIAEISRRWFRVRDSYGVEVAPGQHDVVVLAVTVCLDLMMRAGR